MDVPVRVRVRVCACLCACMRVFLCVNADLVELQSGLVRRAKGKNFAVTSKT